MSIHSKIDDFKHDFIVFFPCDWETPWRGHYLIKALSEQLSNSKILCVEYPVDLFLALFKHPFLWIKQLNRKNHLRKVSDNLFVYRPRIFLNEHIASKIPSIGKINVNWLQYQLQDIIEKYRFNKKSLITWFSDPFQESFVGMLEEKLSIFDCYDEYTSVKSWPVFRTKQQIQEHEKRLLNKANITFVVSDTLYRKKSPYANTIKILSNAADTKHFKSLNKSEHEFPQEILNIPRPIIGYLGALSDKVDISMLCRLAENHPEWSFISIGAILDNIDKSKIFKIFLKKKNVYILGSQPYKKLPYYLNAFDVCLLPLLVSHPFNINCSPLKLYEYLATGKPIVSTDIPYIRKFRDVVRIGRDGDSIENCIQKCFGETDDLKKKRIAIAKENSWERRVHEVLAIIKDKIEKDNET
mgnify:CR=1 FL=1